MLSNCTIFLNKSQPWSNLFFQSVWLNNTPTESPALSVFFSLISPNILHANLIFLLVLKTLQKKKRNPLRMNTTEFCLIYFGFVWNANIIIACLSISFKHWMSISQQWFHVNNNLHISKQFYKLWKLYSNEFLSYILKHISAVKFS